jgi:hypothetical protein
MSDINMFRTDPRTANSGFLREGTGSATGRAPALAEVSCGRVIGRVSCDRVIGRVSCGSGKWPARSGQCDGSLIGRVSCGRVDSAI